MPKRKRDLRIGMRLKGFVGRKRGANTQFRNAGELRVCCLPMASSIHEHYAQSMACRSSVHFASCRALAFLLELRGKYVCNDGVTRPAAGQLVTTCRPTDNDIDACQWMTHKQGCSKRLCLRCRSGTPSFDQVATAKTSVINF